MWDFFKQAWLHLLPLLGPLGQIARPAVAIVYTVYTWIEAVIEIIGEAQIKYGSLYNAYLAVQNLLGNHAFGALPVQLEQPLKFLNAFLPLTEALVLIAATLIVYMMSLGLRIAKSWIPTVN